MTKTINITCKGADYLDISEMVHFQHDLKILDDINYEKLKSKILSLGFSEPIGIWKNNNKNYIISGHQRNLTLTRMREEGYEIPLIPISIIEADNIKQAKKKVLSLTSQFGEITQAGLADFCQNNDFNIDEIQKEFRFPELNFEEIKEDEPIESKDDDFDPSEISKKTDIKVGDLFEIGDHRLLCGDSTIKENWDKLMNGKIADLYISDPPYGVKYEGKTKDSLTIQNDAMSADDTHKLFKDALLNVLANLKNGGGVLCNSSCRTITSWIYACNARARMLKTMYALE